MLKITNNNPSLTEEEISLVVEDTKSRLSESGLTEVIFECDGTVSCMVNRMPYDWKTEGKVHRGYVKDLLEFIRNRI